MFHVELTLSLEKTAIEIGIYHTIIWKFLRAVLKIFSYKIEIHQKKKSIKRTPIAKFLLLINIVKSGEIVSNF